VVHALIVQKMRIPRRYLPVITLLGGFGSLIGYAAYSSAFNGSFSPFVISAILIALGVSLSIVQIRCGFSLQLGGPLVSRDDEDSSLYWWGFYCNTVPYIVAGFVILWVC